MTTAASTPTSPLVKPLFDLPASIHRIGFVEILSEAIERPRITAQNYVVTPPIAAAFDKALRLVSTSLRDNRSQASFLHGSFGSGKSHFMALLSLMLANAEDAWRVPELHPLRATHPFIPTAKLLQLHFHVVGNDANLEAIVFRKYLAHVRTHHPDAPVPGLFADERLFADARHLLEELGDTAFFAPMNETIAPATAATTWGKLARKPWDRERFEHTAASSDPETRQTLFSALVKTRFRSFAEESRAFVDLDAGLATIGRHAKTLGYHGVVLFLDELILWLASHASNVEWFHNEVQKMVKLVESEDAHREIPFVSFIARQRDLAEMVGEDYLGSDDKRVRDSLKWSAGRYETITLEDRNLPAIVKKRVLRPRDEAAAQTLERAFTTLERGAKASWKTMLGQLDADAFRQLYPFSPALVDALVALSNSLQRERTAIKLLTEILVEHIEDLPIGGVVGVGDLYDVLAGGEDHADGVMKARFEAAKHMYTHRLLPLLQQAHGTDRPDTCQRLRPEHPARLGCSNCPKVRCRADNRLVKTLVIGALVPEVGALKDMTASRLVQLNHGSLTVPIPGTEASVVAQRLRAWASELGQLHVGPGSDPTVRLQIEGVELGPILEQAKHVDTSGARQRVLKDLLFQAMGVDTITDWGKDHKHKDWRGTDRLGHIRFGNVRKMGPETLRCPDTHDWRLIVDYPFDDEGHGPHDDLRVVERFAEEHGSWTLVWLPTFFSHAMTDMLGELVILEHILESRERARGYVSHLSVENQSRAMNDLENLRTQKQSRVLAALEQAYGLAQAKEGDLDTALAVERHLHVLKSGAQLQPGLAANLATALEAYIPALLEARYPRHPRLGKKLTPKRVDELVERFGEIVDSPDKRIPADKALVEELRGTLGELGLVRTTENAVHLVEDRTLQELERKRAQAASERPEVGEIRRFIDPTGKMGLQDEALDLVVRCYARHTARTFVAGGEPYTLGKSPIPDYVVLDKPDLPSPSAWVEAIAVVGDTLGMSFAGRALHADNLKRFQSDLAKRISAAAGPCTRLPALLRQRAEGLGVPADADRLVTADSGAALFHALAGRPAKEQVEQLAAFGAKTSRRAVGASIGAAERMVTLLGDNLVFGAFEQLRGRAAELPGAAELLEDVAATLRQDELVVAAADRLRALAERAQAILNPPPPPGRVLYEASLRHEGRDAVLAGLRALVAAVEQATHGEGEALAMTGQVRITAPGKAR